MSLCQSKNAPIAKFKEYDSISFTCLYTGAHGEAIPLSGVSITSHLKTVTGALIGDMAVIKDDTKTGVFVLKPNRAHLPVGIHKIDILFTISGQSVASDTFYIEVLPAVTTID